MAIATVQLAVADMLSVELRNVGWVEGHVVWVREFEFGLTFLHEINAKAVRHIPKPAQDVADLCVRRPLAISITPPEQPDHSNLRRI